MITLLDLNNASIITLFKKSLAKWDCTSPLLRQHVFIHPTCQKNTNNLFFGSSANEAFHSEAQCECNRLWILIRNKFGLNITLSQNVPNVNGYLIQVQITKKIVQASASKNIQYELDKYTKEVVKTTRMQNERLQNYLISHISNIIFQILNSLWPYFKSKWPYKLFSFNFRYIDNAFPTRLNLTEKKNHVFMQRLNIPLCSSMESDPATCDHWFFSIHC